LQNYKHHQLDFVGGPSSWWKCSSGWHAICFALNGWSRWCRTTFQLIRGVARVSRQQLSLLFGTVLYIVIKYADTNTACST